MVWKYHLGDPLSLIESEERWTGFGIPFWKEDPCEELRRDGMASSIDVSETKNELVVKAELPGMDSKDIDISMSNGFLTIKGEKKHEKEEKDENYHLIERSYGSFTRSVRLPKEVQSEKIMASFKNGVLRVTLPKSEEAKKKRSKSKSNKNDSKDLSQEGRPFGRPSCFSFFVVDDDYRHE